ncbi:MAG: FMN-binding protein [Firmicutes bacterium]|nr:FMN-binding protein [Bacillota bacterium]
MKKYENNKVLGAYVVKNQTKEKMLVQLIKSKGYKDDIYILTFIDIKENKLKKVDVYKHKETPAYGGYIEDDWFLKRFKNKDVNVNLELVKMSANKENEIVAVTGATISSRSVINGVNISFDNYLNMLKEENK